MQKGYLPSISCVGVKDINVVHLKLVVCGCENVDIRFAENHKEVPVVGVSKVFGHVEVGIHSRLHQGHTVKFLELRRVSVVDEGARAPISEKSLIVQGNGMPSA